MTIARPSGVDNVIDVTNTKTHIHINVHVCYNNSGKKKTIRTSSPCVGNKFSFGGDSFW